MQLSLQSTGPDSNLTQLRVNTHYHTVLFLFECQRHKEQNEAPTQTPDQLQEATFQTENKHAFL